MTCAIKQLNLKVVSIFKENIFKNIFNYFTGYLFISCYFFLMDAQFESRNVEQQAKTFITESPSNRECTV